jgi:hypothetical protein
MNVHAVSAGEGMVDRITQQVWTNLITPLWREKNPLAPSVVIAPAPGSPASHPQARAVGVGAGGNTAMSEICFDFSVGSAKSSAEANLSLNEDLFGAGGVQVNMIIIVIIFIIK